METIEFLDTNAESIYNSMMKMEESNRKLTNILHDIILTNKDLEEYLFTEYLLAKSDYSDVYDLYSEKTKLTAEHMEVFKTIKKIVKSGVSKDTAIMLAQKELGVYFRGKGK